MAATSGRKGRPWRRIREQVLGDCPVCWLCGLPIDRALPPNHPMSATVDHVEPLSLGGDPLDPSGLRPAHHGCNSRRGNRITTPKAVRSRAW